MHVNNSIHVIYPILYLGNMQKRFLHTHTRDLFEIANLQKGYFTAQQAIKAGIPDSVHPYHIRAGNWTREQRGIYRLVRYPSSDYENLMVWYLWSRNHSDIPQGVFSHATALSLFEISDANPVKIHMTVPNHFRRSQKIPKMLVLHKHDLKQEDITERLGIKLTTPLRTLLDVVTESSLSLDLIEQAVQQAVSRGIVIEKTIRGYPELAYYLKKKGT